MCVKNSGGVRCCGAGAFEFGMWGGLNAGEASFLQMPLVLLQGFGLFCLESDLICLFLGLWGCAGLVYER